VSNEFMSTSGSRASVLLAQLEHLPGDDVEEGLALLDLEQRLRLLHAHARPEPAVELDHDGLVERLGVGLVGQVVVGGDVGELVEVGVGEHPRLARLELLVVVGEGGDRGVGHARVAHLLLAGLQSLVHHAPS
jgi:hypothetical protein